MPRSLASLLLQAVTLNLVDGKNRVSNLLCWLLNHLLTLAKTFTEFLLYTKYWGYKSRLREPYSVEVSQEMLKNNCKEEDSEKTAFWEHDPNSLSQVPFCSKVKNKNKRQCLEVTCNARCAVHSQGRAMCGFPHLAVWWDSQWPWGSGEIASGQLLRREFPCGLG